MEMHTQIDKKRNLRSHRVTGLINVSELKQKLEEFYISPAYDPKMDALWDMRDADFSAVTTDEIYSFVNMVKSYWGQTGQGKSAIVVESVFDYGMTRMYEIILTLNTSSNIMVFKDYDEAQKWLKE
jgi:hypothetical protein